jgi:hypothetical protein
LKKIKGPNKPITQLTTNPTEADLEAEIHRALTLAFPWIPASDLKHQTKFSFKLGRTTIDVDGEESFRVEGRADVIVKVKDKPLAVLELKRFGNPITPEDADQGLSYARMLTPMPPLVVVTNGLEVRLLETHTGQDWKPDNVSEAELAKLIDAASRAASADIKQAVQILLGTSSDIWVSAVRQATAMCLEDMSGRWDNPLVPFVQNFLIPREATQEVLAALRKPSKTVIVHGAPLAGKTNVLRELAVLTANSPDLAVLVIEADGNGPGIFQQLANVLANTLAWPVSADEVRAWLRRLSNEEGPALVLAMDGIHSGNEEIRKDIEELCSRTFGQNIRMVISMDDTAVVSFTLNASGRKSTVIGRLAVTVEVLPLNDQEFKGALQTLWDHRIGFMPGVQSAAEMRAPWVLRATAAGAMEHSNSSDENLTAILAPMLGLNLIDHARGIFADPELRRQLQEVAKAVLEDSADRARNIALVLESVGLFMVRRKTLTKFLDRDDINSLNSKGVLKPGMHASGEAVFFVRLPELLASELSLILADELAMRVPSDAQAAAEWLTEISTGLPLGDIIAAQAIFDAATTGVMTLDFINSLVSVPPREEGILPGTKFAMHIPGFGLARLEFQEDGSLVWTANGRREVIPAEEDESFGSMIADHRSWLVLSHLALRPFVMESMDGKKKGRLDPLLLLELGTCRYTLRGPQNDPEKNMVLTHSVPNHGNIVCHHAGVVEPVTMAILRLLSSGGTNETEWIKRAVERQSFALLARIDISLQQLDGSADEQKSAWANKMREDILKPALESFPLLH